MLNVQFSDSTDTIIVSYFGAPQNPEEFQNLGQVTTADPRWKTFFDGLSLSVQQALPQPTES
jgi:hypothetical protein